MTARTITTAAELDALPVGSVILDNMGDAGLIDERDGERLVQYAETSRVSLRHAAKHYLPATVLHDPSAPAAPSATREDVEAVLDEVLDDASYADGTLAHDAEKRAADALLARFTITPRTDR